MLLVLAHLLLVRDHRALVLRLLARDAIRAATATEVATTGRRGSASTPTAAAATTQLLQMAVATLATRKAITPLSRARNVAGRR